MQNTITKVTVLLFMSTFALSSALPHAADAQFLQTIMLISGDSTVGTLDPNTEFSDDGGTSWQQAVIVPSTIPVDFPPFSVTYDTIPGTHYLARNSGATTVGLNETIPYRTFFTLPTDFSRPTLRMQLHADNAVTIFLNGTKIGGHRIFNEPRNFQNPADRFFTVDASLFQAGTNELRFDLFNSEGPSLLDYKATVTFIPLKQAEPDLTPIFNPCKNPTHVGTDGNEVFILEGGPFVVDAKGGNDIIITGDEDDIICAGDGDDIVVSHDGNDQIYGGRGNDQLDGRSGRDRIFGERGDDTIEGGTGFDFCNGGPGNDTVTGCP